jgi:Lrp/AsnC family transcriptional regulator for asnA, asnC and gidA
MVLCRRSDQSYDTLNTCGGDSTTSNGFVLDALDLRIISALEDDGRKPASEIALTLGVPRTTVARRIERLVGEQVIRVGVFANSAKIGLPVHAMTEICVEPAVLDAVVEAVAAFDELRWVGMVTGHFDVLIEGMFRSDDHLRDFLTRLAKVRGITRMRTMHVLKVPKLAFTWELMLHAGEETE